MTSAKEKLQQLEDAIKQSRRTDVAVILYAFPEAALFWNALPHNSLVCQSHQAGALAQGLVFADPNRIVIILSDTDGEDISGIDIVLKTQTNKIIKIKLQ